MSLFKSDQIEKCSESIGIKLVLYFLNFFSINFQPQIIDSLFALAKFLDTGINLSVGSRPSNPEIPIIDKSFGYETAVDKAKYAIMSAYTEAKDTEHGLGIVKLMGRSCGWIALAASLASYNVDICLIPEYEFNIDKVDKYIEHVMNEKDYCVIVVAEGVKIGDSEDDIGIFLKTRYENDYCVKYIDPTYQIRALPANTSDSIYCKLLAQSAVHAVMNGYSESTIGLVNNKLCVIPLDEIVNETNFVPELMWFRLLQSTLQPSFL